MRSTSLFSLFGIALCMSAAVVACSGDDDDNSEPAQTPSDIGQSCTRTADCKSPYVCIDQVCEKKGTAGNAGEGNQGTGGSTGGTSPTAGKGGTAGTFGNGGKPGTAGTGSVTPPPVLGGEGESCTRAADCETDLHCFNQRCTKTETTGAGGEGGMGSVAPPIPKLGQEGETCALSSDCDTGLACLPGGAGTIPNEGFVGVCTKANSGITPTGKDCHAECVAPEDCCQLPPSLLTSSMKSCADLAKALDGVDCVGSPGSFAEQCFIQAAYCACDKSTWKCNEGSCEYAAACQSSGLTINGCPLASRTDRALISTCTDGHCQAAAVTPVCTADADCDTQQVADDVGDRCSPGECTCYKSAGLCYRKCSSDLNCAAGKVCDTKAHLCMAAPECSEDVTCQTIKQNVNAACQNGACVVTCDNDLNCNTDLTTGLADVCNTNHVCEPIGCSDDSQCVTTTNPSLHLFCTTKLTTDTTGGPSSAVTDGT
jgi:hypothetical protein